MDVAHILTMDEQKGGIVHGIPVGVRALERGTVVGGCRTPCAGRAARVSAPVGGSPGAKWKSGFGPVSPARGGARTAAGDRGTPVEATRGQKRTRTTHALGTSRLSIPGPGSPAPR